MLIAEAGTVGWGWRGGVGGGFRVRCFQGRRRRGRERDVCARVGMGLILGRVSLVESSRRRPGWGFRFLSFSLSGRIPVFPGSIALFPPSSSVPHVSPLLPPVSPSIPSHPILFLPSAPLSSSLPSFPSISSPSPPHRLFPPPHRLFQLCIILS